MWSRIALAVLASLAAQEAQAETCRFAYTDAVREHTVRPALAGLGALDWDTGKAVVRRKGSRIYLSLINTDTRLLDTPEIVLVLSHCGATLESAWLADPFVGSSWKPLPLPWPQATDEAVPPTP